MILVGAAVGGVHVPLSANSSAGCYLAIFVASVLGLATAYQAARLVAARLNRYRCVGCRAPVPLPVSRVALLAM